MKCETCGKEMTYLEDDWYCFPCGAPDDYEMEEEK